MSASAGYLTATSLQGLVINSQSSYQPERWQGTLLVFALMFVAIIFNTFLSKHLPKIENGILWVHILGFVIVLVCLTVLAPNKSSSSDVWAQFLNQGGYESKSLSFFVGLITPVFSFMGADGAVHMAEEIQNSSRVLPKAMLGASSPLSFLTIRH
jgi:amino acid transporter